MRLAVLCANDSWYYRDLARAAESLPQVTLEPAAFSDISVAIRHDRVRCEPLESFDAVLVRTMPPGSLEQVVFRMDALHQLQDNGRLVVNSPRAVEIAVDKFLCTSLLQRAGIATPKSIVCQTPEQAMEAFERLGGNVVLKPIFGGEGRGITRLDDPALMLRASKMLSQMGAVLYLQEFIEHEGSDIRVLVMGDRCWAMRRSNPNDWRTNASRGAVTERVELVERWETVARQAAAAAQTDFAGVDILPARDGRELVLEVNAVPGWKALGAAHELDVARELLIWMAARPSRTSQES